MLAAVAVGSLSSNLTPALSCHRPFALRTYLPPSENFLLVVLSLVRLLSNGQVPRQGITQVGSTLSRRSYLVVTPTLDKLSEAWGWQRVPPGSLNKIPLMWPRSRIGCVRCHRDKHADAAFSRSITRRTSRT